MVGRRTKGRRKLLSGWLCVLIARKGAYRPSTELAGMWELVSGPNRRRFYDQYGQIASLVTMELEEPLIRAVIQFWNPSYRCFIFNGEDLVPMTEEYFMLIRLNL